LYGQPISVYNGHHSFVTGVVFENVAGQLMASSSLDSTIKLWHQSMKDSFFTLQTSHPIHSVQFVPGEVHMVGVCTMMSRRNNINSAGYSRFGWCMPVGYQVNIFLCRAHNKPRRTRLEARKNKQTKIHGILVGILVKYSAANGRGISFLHHMIALSLRTRQIYP
jgi:WD40 repeat protein